MSLRLQAEVFSNKRECFFRTEMFFCESGPKRTENITNEKKHFERQKTISNGNCFLNGNVFCESGRERTAKILFEPKKTFLGYEGTTTEIQRKYKGNTKEI